MVQKSFSSVQMKFESSFGQEENGLSGATKSFLRLITSTYQEESSFLSFQRITLGEKEEKVWVVQDSNL